MQNAIDIALYQENLQLLDVTLTNLFNATWTLQQHLAVPGYDVSDDLCNVINVCTTLSNAFNVYSSAPANNFTSISSIVVSVAYIHLAALREKYLFAVAVRFVCGLSGCDVS